MTKDFKEGDRVRYVPSHARERTQHPDCENGVVTSVNQHYVFVRFSDSSTPKSCYAHSLVKRSVCIRTLDKTEHWCCTRAEAFDKLSEHSAAVVTQRLDSLDDTYIVEVKE